MAQLKTETNTSTMRARIMRAFRAHFNLGQQHGPACHFEHGQWWVVNTITGAQWSVVDAEGPGSTDGFDFEQVAEGSEA